VTDPQDSIPVIDVSPLVRGGPGREAVARALGRACRQNGFFYAAGHGVDTALAARLETLAREFFAWDEERKLEIRMARGGRAWRGYFPVGGELTSGRPDQKEGLYFGSELARDHPLVRAGLPLHGPNLFPEIAGFRETVLQYLAALTALGQRLMEGVALSLGLAATTFSEGMTRDPLVLFRIFHYPPLPAAAGPGDASLWSVGEHTDYGLLTMLLQDDAGGLQVKTPTGWIDAPPVPGTYVCNIGDMLDRLTRGLYRSTPHRVRNTSGRGRLSFPFFFDPGFHAGIHALPIAHATPEDRHERWDGANVHAVEGTYGDYLLAKVSKVFPELSRDVL